MKSVIKKTNVTLDFPEFLGDQIYMQEFDLANPALPREFEHWLEPLKKMLTWIPSGVVQALANTKSYLTVDQKYVEAGKTHRRGGPHVDGNYTHNWGGGGGWLTGENGRVLSPEKHKEAYCSPTGGMLISSNLSACKGWIGEYDGTPNQGGDCSHLASELETMTPVLMDPFSVYYTNSTAIHESLPFTKTAARTLIRVTLPAELACL
jgi:hypothetical protein